MSREPIDNYPEAIVRRARNTYVPPPPTEEPRIRIRSEPFEQPKTFYPPPDYVVEEKREPPKIPPPPPPRPPEEEKPKRDYVTEFFRFGNPKIRATGRKRPGDWSWGHTWRHIDLLGGSFGFRVIYVNAYGMGYRAKVSVDAWMYGESRVLGPEIDIAHEPDVNGNTGRKWSNYEDRTGRASTLSVNYSFEVASSTGVVHHIGPFWINIAYVPRVFDGTYWRIPEGVGVLPAISITVSPSDLWLFWSEFMGRYMANAYEHQLDKQYGEWVPIDVAFASYKNFVLRTLKANVGVAHPEVQATIVSEAQKYLDWGVVTESELREIGFIIENGRVVGTTEKYYGKPETRVPEELKETTPPRKPEVGKVTEVGPVPVIEEEKKEGDNRGLLALLALVLGALFLGRRK